jgi:hypothetical protein
VKKGTERYTEIHIAFLKKNEKGELTRNFAKNNKKKFADPGSCFFDQTSSNLKKTKKRTSPVISPKIIKKIRRPWVMFFD